MTLPAPQPQKSRSGLIRRQTIKTLTLWNPWAALVAMGVKAVETRSWATKYRGPLAIHSAARIPPEWLGASRHSRDFQAELREVFHEPSQAVMEYKVHALPRGCVLCIVNLVAIQETDKVFDDLTPRERIFGNYEDGRYAWFLELVEKFDVPIPAKGNRMLWNWERV
jgi:hypothetical protein